MTAWLRRRRVCTRCGERWAQVRDCCMRCLREADLKPAPYVSREVARVKDRIPEDHLQPRPAKVVIVNHQSYEVVWDGA